MANLHIHHEQHNTSQILNILVFSSPFSHVFVYTYLICILFKRSTYLVMVIPFTLLLLFILTSFSSLNLYSFPLLGYVHANNYVYTWMNPEQCVCVCFEKKNASLSIRVVHTMLGQGILKAHPGSSHVILFPWNL